MKRFNANLNQTHQKGRSLLFNDQDEDNNSSETNNNDKMMGSDLGYGSRDGRDK